MHSEYQIFLRLKRGRTMVKTVRAESAFAAIVFAESVVLRSTAQGVVMLSPYVSA
jgi:hypothetical protein